MRAPLILPGLLALLASASAAQEVRNLRLAYRDGQTFVTWRESPIAGTTNRVYRSTARIFVPNDLNRAVLLGEVGDDSSLNEARTELGGVDKYWVIEPGGAELLPNDGLFVHTVGEALVRTYYCVTSVRAGVENRQLKGGVNVNSTALLEKAAPPQPVLQTTDGSGEVWAHWVSNLDTPYLPALYQWPNQGFNFRFEPGAAPAPRGLVVALHAAGQTYGQGWP